MKNILKRIIVGIIIGLVLMCARKYLFINVRAETINITNPSYIKYKNQQEQNYYLCGNGCTGSYTFTYFDNTYYGLGSAGSDEYWYGLYYSYDNQSFPTGNYSLQFSLRMKIGLRNADGVNVSVLDSAGHSYYCYTNGSGMNYLYNNGAVIGNTDTYYQGNGIMGVYCPNVDLNSSLHYAINVNGNFHLSSTNSFGISRISLVKENAGVVGAIDNTTSAVNNATSAIEDTNDTLNNDSIGTQTDNDIQGLQNTDISSTEDAGIQDLITLPIELFNGILSALNGTCSPYRLGTLLGADITLPCFNLGNYLGAVWTLIDIILSSCLFFKFAIKLKEIFINLTSLNENKEDLIG